MGNRAIIQLEQTDANAGLPALYLHWNGGLDSVEAFLTYIQLRQIATGAPGLLALATTISNFFGNPGRTTNLVPVGSECGDNGT